MYIHFGLCYNATRRHIGRLYIIICFSLSRPARAQQQIFVQQNPPGRCSPKLYTYQSELTSITSSQEPTIRVSRWPLTIFKFLLEVIPTYVCQTAQTSQYTNATL